MASVNRVTLIGNLGRDPEHRMSADGVAVCYISLATHTYWTDRETGQRREETEWHRVVFFNRLAEIANEYLRKGRAVYVEGRLKTRQWLDKETGIERYVTEIIADNLQMLDAQATKTPSDATSTGQEPPATNALEDITL